MKKILIQLDSDPLPSAFDCIAAYDAGADVVQSYGGVSPAGVRGLLLGAVFTRGIPDLKSIAVWIGGSDVEAGERILAEARGAFFGPFRVSLMLDSNGCNTTASTAAAKLARQADLRGRSAVVLGPGPVGVRVAALLAGEGCRVLLASIPAQLLGKKFDAALAERTMESARKTADAFRSGPSAGSGGSIEVADLKSPGEIEGILRAASILAAAGPAGVRMVPQTLWQSLPDLRYMIDFNLTEPLGIEGIRPGDDFAGYGSVYALGALAVGNPKMKVHKACVAKLFENNDLVLDTAGAYGIAREIVA